MSRKRKALSMKIFLAAMLACIGILPMFLQALMVLGSYQQNQIDTRGLELQNRCLILSNKLSRSGYLDADVKDTLLDNEMDVLADIYSGRIVVVDKNYKFVHVSFRLSEGRIQISEEVLQSFRGESISRYNRDKHYFIHTAPIYEAAGSQNISGVLVSVSSTEAILDQTEAVRDKASLVQLLSLIILGAVICGMIYVFMKPINRFREKLFQVASGALDTDISENTYRETKEMSESVKETLKKLREADASRQEFVANVSHELKTPITSIRVLADSLMSMEDVPAELYREFMNDISDEIDRESKIIDDLLSLVKMEKTAEMNISQVNINALVEQILKRLRPIAAKRNIEITLESMREVTADIDEVKFSLALNNLVENAIKYNKEDGWVRVNLDADHKFFYVKVSDSGVGIPEEFCNKIFERFYRVDKARSRETGGTGLGLAITKSVVQMHQGAIKVKSKEGEGSTFTVRIPLNYIP